MAMFHQLTTSLGSNQHWTLFPLWVSIGMWNGNV